MFFYPVFHWDQNKFLLLLMVCVLKVLLKVSHYFFHNGKTAVRIKKISCGKVNGISFSCSCTEGSQSPFLKVGKEVYHRRKPILLDISTASHPVIHLFCMPLCQTPPQKHRLGMGKWRKSSTFKSCFDSLMPLADATCHSEVIWWRAAAFRSRCWSAVCHQKQRPAADWHEDWSWHFHLLYPYTVEVYKRCSQGILCTQCSFM